MKKIKLSLLLLVFHAYILCGQEIYFQHYMVENGLSHNTIISSIQDHKGFLWFGTKNGLNRFDGYNFRLFQNNPDDPKSIKGNYIESLHENDSIIWVGTDSGLFRYNESLENFDIIEGTANAQVLDIENDANGNLWFISQSTLSKYNLTTKEIKEYPTTEFFNATDIHKLKNNEIWISSTNYLYQYNETTDSFNEYPLEIEAELKRPLRINELFNLDEQTLLLGTQNHGVLAFDMVEKKLKSMAQITSESYYVRDFAIRADKELWVASESGLHIYDLKTKAYTNLKKNYDNPYALSDNAVYSLTIDKENGVWAGTYFGGINYTPHQYSPFTKFFPMSSQNSINGNAVREIRPDDFGNLWIGTEDAGLNKFNPKTGKFTNYTSLDKNKNGILTHYNIHGLLPVADKLWIGMFDNGIDILDINRNKIIKHYNIGQEGALRSNFVFALHKSKENVIFVVTTYGIQTYDPITDKYTLYDVFPENHHYTCFYEDRQGTLWAGTYSDGLYYYNPTTKEKGFFKYEGNNPSSISNNHINGIFEDSKNNIWISTEYGLNLLNKNKKDFTKFTTKNGFPSNVFYGILEDDNKNIWITTSNGLVQFDSKNDIKKIYTKANGLKSDQFNYNSAYKDPNGRMYFGTVNGMISFNPKDFKKNTYSPPIYITGLQINNKEVFVDQTNSPIKESISSLENLVLSPEQSSFSLEFAALSYIAPENTEYWYKMEGLNNDWIYLQKDHKVYFTELAAGNYNFIVKSMNSSGVWGKETSGLNIKVLPIFWKSNLAYTIYTALTCFLIFIGFRNYDQRVKSKNIQKIKQLNNRKEKEIYQAKIEFFTNVSHEIRTPLTLIKSPLEKVLKKSHEVPGIKDNLAIVKKNTNRLLDLVNQLLDFRKTEIERVDLTFVETNISELIDDTYARFSEAIRDKKVDFSLKLEDKDVIACVDPEALKKILSNLFSNAIKYADKVVIVSLKSNESGLKLNLRNDGLLIPGHLKERIFEPFYRVSGNENQTGTGIGLALARSLTEMHNGSLNLNTSDGTMNSFVLQLPIHQEKEFRLRPKSSQKWAETESITNVTISPNQGNCILLVEDSEELLDFVAKELKEEYFVLKASNGEDALNLLIEDNVQLVISDVMMPGINGFTLCKKIKTNLETSHIPVILLTSKSAMSAKMEGLESGADAYIEKPFSIKHLKVHIANLLENRKNIMEHYASSPLAHIRSIANTKTDETFIKKLDEVIYQNMSDSDLNVETLAEIMNMSRSTLYRKIKDISNLSPNELINIARLKKSAELLKSGKYRIFEVAEIVGYNSATSFGRNFQKQFEMTPSDYMNDKN
ncbi:two-component regulator propeller domain-containing protein [Maribacter confluentis]|uniref:histidine kinase n=1 Tax=Maribacter confluentis TaxID=1656093 RepID=A0ABT8RMN5_9FLAO|nr:two-component regulator propeller domain-containing protein [Maribacter confluentis]MDO1512182.1 two-component regulator propeller domain-containing protein [Maribacter confluentis]